MLATPALAGPPPPYELFFVPPTPLPPNVTEGAAVMFGVALQNGCAGPFTPITWDVSLVPVTADATDYGPPTPGSLMYSEGMLTQIFSVDIFDDGVTEGAETFDILLTPGVGGVDLNCSAPPQMPSQPMYNLTVTINDAGPPMLGDVTIGDAVAPENQPMISFDVFLAPPNPGPMPVTVDWATGDGSAIGGQDFVVAAGQVTFLPGDGAEVIQIQLLDDALVEGDENFVIDLTNPSPTAQILDPQAVGTIQDDDMLMPVDVFIDDTTVQESTPGFATFDINLSQPNPDIDPVTVNWTTNNGTAISGQDYGFSSGIVNFAPGEANKTIQVPILDDAIVEGEEFFFVDLTGVSTNGQITDAQGECTIQDDDVAALIDISIDDSAAMESQPTIGFDVHLSVPNPGPGPVTVNWATANGSAIAGADFVGASGQVTFLPGDANRLIAIDLIDDSEVEPTEAFFVNLSSPSASAQIVDGQGQGSIQDDDAGTEQPIVSIDDATVVEGDDGPVGAMLTVRLSIPPDQGVQVDFATADGTATVEDNDYQATSGTVSFPPGTTTRTVTIPVVGDLRVEDDETFSVQLSNPQGAMLGDGQAIVTIENDDQPLPGLIIDDVLVQEGDEGTTDAVFTVTLNAVGEAPQGGVTVHFATADGTATVADDDYRATSGELSFSAGETTRTITVPVVGDTRVEPDEAFFVDLSDPVGAVIIEGRGRGAIRNDDSTAPPILSISDVAVDEGDEGTTAAVFRVDLSMPSEMAVSVGYETADGTA
ncbi:MAG: Calx-beta domain-containing protein, partial [Acidobacteriota bacterium]